MSAHTPGPWLIATSNSWRRIVSESHRLVCEPIVQSDGHPDLWFRNGGPDGPDARLIAAAPDLLAGCRMIWAATPSEPGSVTAAFAAVGAAINKAEGKS